MLSNVGVVKFRPKTLYPVENKKGAMNVDPWKIREVQ